MFDARVLLVEDDSTVNAMVSRMLETLGCRVQSARDGREGLEYFGQGVFDMVVTDVNMPGMDGIEMIREIQGADPSVISLIMTGRRDQETAVRALECGVHRFLLKPFDRKALSVKIEEAMRERRRLVQTRLLVGDLIRARGDLHQKLSEQDQKITRMEGYLQHLLDAAPFGILSADREGRILTFNHKAEQMYGYRSGEMVGKALAALFHGAASPGAGPKTYHQNKDGKRFPVLVHERDIVEGGGECIARLYVVEDLSERECLEAQLLNAERLSLLGQMAPRIAHEFKTPLQLIMGYAELRLTYLEGSLEEEQVREARLGMEQILAAAKQMGELVQQMARLGKPVESKWEALDLRQVLEELLGPLQQLGLIKSCALERDFAGEVAPIRGDRGQLAHLFQNLIVNAAQAMERSERKLLRLSIGIAAGGEHVEAAIRDTGPGIAPEHLERIFDPFFTTKSEGKGTGLGLAIVRNIADNHGAGLRLESAPGEGTCFYLSFPVAAAETG